MKRYLHASIACAILAAFLPGEAVAKQCIFNKGGYVLKVHWFKVGTIAKRYKDGPGLTALEAPVQSDTLTAGVGACTKSDETHIAAVNIPGCVTLKMYGIAAACNTMTFAEGQMPVATFQTLVGGGNVFYHPATGVPGARPMIGPLGCDHAANYNLTTKGICNVTTASFPESSAWIGVPSATHYLDFWGSIFDVQWGPGGPVK